MQGLPSYLFIMLLLVLGSNRCKSLDCQLNESDKHRVAYTITVDKSGHGNFTSVQSAIDSIPAANTRWIRVQISPGNYEEKVVIPLNKPCIFLEGAGSKLTSIVFGDDQDKDTSATFISLADNIVAKGITIKNSYNLPLEPEKIVWKRATAAVIQGDKSAFYNCAFLGIQDTLYDVKGRHYFNGCYIEGALDFIYGGGKSIYERCEISISMGRYEQGLHGCMTTQKKLTPEEPSGFVFQTCAITGSGKAYLGRAWGPYSTVVIHNSFLSDVIDPVGWDAWRYPKHEANFTYAEINNKGPGADTSKRVPWLEKPGDPQLAKFLNISYIDEDGWLAKLPMVS